MVRIATRLRHIGFATACCAVLVPAGAAIAADAVHPVKVSRDQVAGRIFEDYKPAGFETLAVRSGYNGNDMGAYMEVRDDRVCFFVRVLARGKHSVSYRMRAEIPGKFSALPARAEAMYAPELKGNSDEIKLSVTD